MKSYYYLFLIGLSILALSCSDNTTQQTVKSFDYREYMPLDSGNTWVYEYYGYDSTGSDYNAPYGRETVIATDSIFFQDRKATKMESIFVNNGNPSSNNFLYSIDTNQIAISGMNFKIHDSLSYTEDRWVVLYDIDQYTGPWINERIEYNDTVIGDSKYYGSIDIEGRKTGKTRIENEGQFFDAATSKLIVYYNIERKRESDTTLINKREEYEFRFAENIGIVYTSFQVFKDTVFISGNKRILIDREF